MIAIELATVSGLPLINRSRSSRTNFRAIRIMHILLRLLLLLCLSSGLLSLTLGLGLCSSCSSAAFLAASSSAAFLAADIPHQRFPHYQLFRVA